MIRHAYTFQKWRKGLKRGLTEQKKSLLIYTIQDGGAKKATPHQFFPCNFYELAPKTSDF